MILMDRLEGLVNQKLVHVSNPPYLLSLQITRIGFPCFVQTAFYYNLHHFPYYFGIVLKQFGSYSTGLLRSRLHKLET